MQHNHLHHERPQQHNTNHTTSHHTTSARYQIVSTSSRTRARKQHSIHPPTLTFHSTQLFPNPYGGERIGALMKSRHTKQTKPLSIQSPNHSPVITVPALVQSVQSAVTVPRPLINQELASHYHCRAQANGQPLLCTIRCCSVVWSLVTALASPEDIATNTSMMAEKQQNTLSAVTTTTSKREDNQKKNGSEITTITINAQITIKEINKQKKTARKIKKH